MKNITIGLGPTSVVRVVNQFARGQCAEFNVNVGG
jgi:hypothetical protein